MKIRLAKKITRVLNEAPKDLKPSLRNSYGHHIFKEERMLSEDILATDWEEV